MAYSNKFPIRITVGINDYNIMLEGLKANENDFTGFLSGEAKSLREKMEKYGKHETDEEGYESVRLFFYESEGKQFIWQFIAASHTTSDYRKLLQAGEKYLDD